MSAMIRVSGLEGVQKELNAMARKVRLQHMKKALRDAANPILAAAKAGVPKKGGKGSTGALHKSLGLVERSKNWTSRVVIGPRSRMPIPRHEVTEVKLKGKRRADQYIEVRRKKGAAKGKIQVNTPTRYAHLIEFGFTHKRGSTTTRIAPKPFMRPAWARYGGEKAVQTFTDSLRKQLGL